MTWTYLFHGYTGLIPKFIKKMILGVALRNASAKALVIYMIGCLTLNDVRSVGHRLRDALYYVLR